MAKRHDHIFTASRFLPMRARLSSFDNSSRPAAVSIPHTHEYHSLSPRSFSWTHWRLDLAEQQVALFLTDEDGAYVLDGFDVDSPPFFR